MHTNGWFIKTVIAVTSALVVLGVIASVAQASDTNAKLAAISVQISGLQDTYKTQGEGLEKTKIAVRALEMLLGRINSNHTVMKTELLGIQERLRRLEMRTQSQDGDEL